jgi:hypothetical protein
MLAVAAVAQVSGQVELRHLEVLVAVVRVAVLVLELLEHQILVAVAAVVVMFRFLLGQMEEPAL